MAKRPMVSFGLSGPVTQPTSDVPGGAAGAGGAGAAPELWLRRELAERSAGGTGAGGTTSACCCTRAERGESASRIADGI